MSGALQNCEFCGSPAHVWFNCPKKPDGWRPDRLKHGKPRVGIIAHVVHDKLLLTAAITKVLSETPGLLSAGEVERNRGGRPISANPKSKRAEYQRNLMRKRRAKPTA